GAGLHVLAGGRKLASAPALGRLTARLPAAPPPTPEKPSFNYAVNNEGTHYPRAFASHTAPGTFPGKANDGNHWYHRPPPNRWTCAGSGRARDWYAIDFGIRRTIDTVKLYLLDDGRDVVPPARVELEYWDGGKWAAVPGQAREPARPTGRRANVIRFPALETQKVRAVFSHARGAATGLTEFEAWGPGRLPIVAAPPPPGNLALNPTGRGYPRASASFTSRHDQVKMVNDGRIFLTPAPHNRW